MAAQSLSCRGCPFSHLSQPFPMLLLAHPAELVTFQGAFQGEAPGTNQGRSANLGRLEGPQHGSVQVADLLKNRWKGNCNPSCSQGSGQGEWPESLAGYQVQTRVEGQTEHGATHPQWNDKASTAGVRAKL